MAQLGQIPASWDSSWVFFGFNTENNISTQNLFTMPAGGGTITSIVFNCAQLSGSGSGPMSAIGCLWSSTGTLIASGSTVTLPTDTQHGGPYPWNTSTLSFAMSAGTQFRIGWWRDPANAAGSNIFSFGTGGTFLEGTTAGSTGAGAFGQDATGTGYIGAYVVYTPTTPPPPPPLLTDKPNTMLYALMRRRSIPGPGPGYPA